MAKKKTEKQLTPKQQMMQQIANYQVQTALGGGQNQQNGMQQLQAEYDKWNAVQSLQSEYDTWLKAQQPQTPKVTKVQQTYEPVKFATAEERRAMKAAQQLQKDAPFDPEKSYDKIYGKAGLDAAANSLTGAQQIPKLEEYVQAFRAEDNKKKEILREIAKDKSPKKSYMEVYTEQSLKRKDQDPEVRQGRTRVRSQQIAADMADITGKNRKSDTSLDMPTYRSKKDNSKVNFEELASKLKKSYKERGAIPFTRQYNNWKNPYSELSADEKQAVKDFIVANQDKTNLSKADKETLRALTVIYNTSGEKNIDTSNALKNSESDAYKNAMAFGGGFTSFNAPLTKLLASGVDKLPIAGQAIDENFNQQLDDLLDSAKEKNPELYEAGRSAGQLYDYALTSPIANTLGAAANLGTAGTVALNQAIQAGQDLGLDILPEAQRMLKENGAIDWNELSKRAGVDLVSNAAMEAIPFLGSANYDYLARTVGNNADIFRRMDASGAVRNVPDAIREIDDLVNGATRQANEAAANIDNLASQIPEVDPTASINNQFSDIMRRYNAETPSMRDVYTADDLSRSMDNQFSELMKQRPQEPVNTIPSLEELQELEREARAMDDIDDYSNIWANPANNTPTANAPTRIDLPEDVQELLVSDFQDMYRMMDDMSAAAEATGNEAVLKKFERLQNRMFDLENTLWKSESTEDITKAKKAADAARQAFIREMRKVNPSYQAELTGTRIGNAAYRRTSMIPDERVSQELADSIIEAENTLPQNRYAVDATPDSVNVFRGVNDVTQRPQNISIEEVRGKNGKPRYYVAETTENGTIKPLESGKTYKSIDEANEAAYNLQYFAGDTNAKEPKFKTSQAYTNTSARGGGWTPEEMSKHTKEHNYLYETIDEQRSVEEAARMRETEGREAFKNRVLYSDRVSSIEIDGLMMEWRELVEEARAAEAAGKRTDNLWGEANKIFRKVQEQSTDNAQALQALAKWSRNTPEGMLVNAENIINGKTKAAGSSDLQKAFEKFAKKNKNFEFPPEFTKNFITEAEKLQGLNLDSREAKEIMARLGKMVNEQIPVKLNEKLQTFLMDNMLGNFRTLIARNAGGNVGLNLAEQTLQRPLAAGIDKLVSLKTGKRTQAGLSVQGLTEYLQGFRKGLVDEITDARTGLHTARSGENTLEQAITSNRRIFKNKLLNLGDQLVRHGLSVGDRPFYESVYKQTLGDYQRLYDRGVMGEVIQKLSPEEFKQYSEVAAKLNALGAVYQQNSTLSNALLQFKRAVGQLSEGTIGVDILSQFSMPFVKTPANVIERAIDYSPLGVVRNSFRTGKEINAGAFDQNRFVNEASRNILGTALMGGAVGLAAEGAISGAYSDDPDRKQAQKESGMQEYALNLPEVDEKQRQMDISWIPVVGSNAVAAAAGYDAYNNGEGDVVGNLATGLTKGGEALFNQSMFQGLQRLFGTGESYNSDQGIVGNMANTVKSGLGQFIPSLARQSAQVADPYMRDLSNSNKDVSFGPMGNYDINSLANNIPYVRQNYLAPKVNTQGELMLENQGRGLPNKILEDMILPGKITEISSGPLYEESMRLSEANNSNKAFLPKANFNAVQQEGAVMSNDEWVDYQQKYYKAMNEGALQLIDSDYYKSLDDQQKEKMLSNAYSDIKSAINSEYTGKELNGAAKAYSEAGGGEAGNKALMNYYITSNLVNAAGTTSTSKVAESIRAAVNRGDLASAQRLADSEAKYQEALDKAGIEGSSAARKAYEKGGSAGLQNYAKYATTLDKYGLSNTESNRAMLDKYGESGLKEHAAFDSLGSEEAFKRYQHAKSSNSGLSASEYVSTVKKIDGTGDKGNVNGNISQDELIAYLNEINATQEEANKLWNTYGQYYSEKPWAKIPKLEGGVWKAKKK